MRLIKRDPLENGAHENLEIAGELAEIPKGWAIIPDNMEIPETFPFVNLEIENQRVINMTAGVMPEPVPEQPSDYEKLEAQVLFTAAMTDTLLEVDI